jgi:GGDEF domain-containing protein
MTQRIRPVLRQGESLFRISDKALAVVLPNMRSADARSFATQVESLSGFPPDNLNVTVTCFPEEAGSLAALESGLRAQ